METVSFYAPTENNGRPFQPNVHAWTNEVGAPMAFRVSYVPTIVTKENPNGPYGLTFDELCELYEAAHLS